MAEQNVMDDYAFRTSFFPVTTAMLRFVRRFLGLCALLPDLTFLLEIVIVKVTTWFVMPFFFLTEKA
jgi:hypothetical protein